MADVSPDHLRQFLLGRLPADDADALGARLVNDDTFGDEVAEQEDGLIAAYLDGTLGGADRQAFDRHYLSTPGHRARVEGRRALAARVATTSTVAPFPAAHPSTPAASHTPSPMVSRWKALAASVLLVVGLWWLRPAPPSPGALPAATTASAPAPPTPAPTTLSAPAAVDPLPVVTLALTPVVTRSGGASPTATVPRGTAQVRFLLSGDLPPNSELTAEIMAVDRDEVKRWPVDVVPGAAPTVAHAVTVPVYAVPAGDYILTVWEGDADMVQRYAFRIVVP